MIPSSGRPSRATTLTACGLSAATIALVARAPDLTQSRLPTRKKNSPTGASARVDSGTVYR